MADRKRRRTENVDGEYFVDSTCIDCDTCRWMAPAVFARAGEQSFVAVQPKTPEQRRDAARALLACPTASIGNESKEDRDAAIPDFPLPIDDDVFHCGFHSEMSFGATSYLIVRPSGNVLVDSPRFVRPLVERIRAMGGVKWFFLTHRDDVADHAKWTREFECARVIHEHDADALGVTPEVIVRGDAPHLLDDDLVVIPTSGHTRGSACLLHDERHLFTGDHLAWSVRLGHLYGFRDACWFDWNELVASTKKLRGLRFEWVLPGHGRRVRYSADEMPRQLDRAIAWMTE